MWKEGGESNGEMMVGLVVRLGGYGVGYWIDEGKKYEGERMVGRIKEFVRK